MRLATRSNDTRDGELVVVSKDGKSCMPAGLIAPTMQQALDTWDEAEPALQGLANGLDSGDLEGEPLDPSTLRSPLPRAYEWIDGSAYINHIVLVRKARGAEPPETLETDPLVYQGGSGIFLDPTGDIPLPDVEWGCDFEAEICVILGDTPRGVSAADAGKYIKLITICNDVTFRNLIPAELKKNFGFFQSKPATAFAPFAVTPDELGDAWQEGRVHLPLLSHLNGDKAGDPDAGPAMHFSFFDLVAHITKTRAFTAGTILGSGTVSNEDESKGVSCLAERRMREILKDGKPTTEFLKPGDSVRIELKDPSGRSICGVIEQKVASE